MRTNGPTYMHTSPIKITTIRIYSLKSSNILNNKISPHSLHRGTDVLARSVRTTKRATGDTERGMSGEEEVREHEEEEEATTTTTEVEVRARRPTREGIYSRCARVVYAQRDTRGRDARRARRPREGWTRSGRSGGLKTKTATGTGRGLRRVDGDGEGRMTDELCVDCSREAFYRRKRR